jgi:hypothetical protein
MREDAPMRALAVEEDGDEVLIPFADVRCWWRLACGGAKLEIREHDNNSTRHWRCPKCGAYYGAAKTQSSQGDAPEK